jgi:hypothetical protein
MKTIIENQNRHSGRVIAGAIIVIFGCLLLVDQLDFVLVPDWVFSWPMFMIALGLYIGVKHNFQNLSWFVLVLIGGAFLADDVLPGIDVGDYIWPSAIIIAGVYIITRNSHKRTIER